jgi:hypothetical protein
MNVQTPILLVLGIIFFLIILLGIEGTLTGNWQTISQNIAPVAIAVVVIGLVVVIIKK